MKKTLSMLAIMSAVLVSCKKTENIAGNPPDMPVCEISISPTELIFDAIGGEQTVTITSSDYWGIDGDWYMRPLESGDWWLCDRYDWLKVSETGGNKTGTITVYVPEFNIENKANESIISFICGDKRIELPVKQNIDDSPIIQFKDNRFLESLLKIGALMENEWHNPNPEESIDKNGDNAISEQEALIVGLYIRDSGIRNINEISYFKNIQFLDCSENQFSDIDLKNNLALTYLQCDDNSLTSLDLSKNSLLTKVSCSNNEISTFDVGNSIHLKELYCNQNNLNRLDVLNNSDLQVLYCSGNQLTALDVSQNATLRDLYCGENKLTMLDVSKNTVLEALYCSDNQITTLDLRNNRSLSRLICDNNPLEKIVLYKYHMLDDTSIRDIVEEYGDIIEYVE